MSDQLKSCPFCGGEAMECFIRATDDLLVWTVECERCGAERGSDESSYEARELWNTRHPDGEREALIEALSEAQEHLTPPRNVWTDAQPQWQSDAYIIVRDVLETLETGVPLPRNNGNG